MSETRSSGRLRKRPRKSYKEPDYDDLDEEDLRSVGKNDSASEEESVPGHKRKKKTPVLKDTRVNKRKIFRWVDLPGEIRNVIYELSLARTHPLRINATTHKNRHVVRLQRFDRQLLNPNLLLINKSTYAEGGPLLYQNEFSFEHSLGLLVFMTNISATPKAWVEKIKLEPGFLVSKQLYSAFSSLSGTTNLTRLSLHEFGHVSPYLVQKITKRLYRNAHVWLEAVGKSKRDKFAGMELIKFEDPMGGCHPCADDFQRCLKAWLE